MCAVRDVLKCGQLSGAWNFLYSGTENCESAAPRPRFPQIPPQAALRRSLRRVRRAAPGQPDIRFRAAVARLSDPCGPADGQAERFAGCRADGSRQKMEQRKRLAETWLERNEIKWISAGFRSSLKPMQLATGMEMPS